MLDVVAEVTPALGFAPAVRFSGLLDTLPADAHRRPARGAPRSPDQHRTPRPRHPADVDLTATRDRVTLDVRDDGTGIGDTTRRSGLANLRHRAEHHGGDLTVDSGPDGTRLIWNVPVG